MLGIFNRGGMTGVPLLKTDVCTCNSVHNDERDHEPTTVKACQLGPDRTNKNCSNCCSYNARVYRFSFAFTQLR